MATMVLMSVGVGLAAAGDGEGQIQRNVTSKSSTSSKSKKKVDPSQNSSERRQPQVSAPIDAQGPDEAPSQGVENPGEASGVAAQEPASVEPQDYADLDVPAGVERAACNGETVDENGVCGGEAAGVSVEASVAPDEEPEQQRQPSQPARTVTVVTVEEIVQRAKAKLDLPKPKIGSAPCTDDGCQGTVGVPTWFWLEDEQWSTQTDSATAGRKSVKIKAKPAKVNWSLGDGQSVSCSGPGTPFDSSQGYGPSPDCGIEQGYQSAGTYTLSATITYDVSITGATEETETITTSSSEQVTIGEAQAIAGQSEN